MYVYIYIYIQIYIYMLEYIQINLYICINMNIYKCKKLHAFALERIIHIHISICVHIIYNGGGEQVQRAARRGCHLHRACSLRGISISISRVKVQSARFRVWFEGWGVTGTLTVRAAMGARSK